MEILTNTETSKKGNWVTSIDAYDFVVNNITQYEGSAIFLVGSSYKTTKL